MELKEMTDEILNRFEIKKKELASQTKMIGELNYKVNTLEKQFNLKEAEHLELLKKWDDLTELISSKVAKEAVK